VLTASYAIVVDRHDDNLTQVNRRNGNHHVRICNGISVRVNAGFVFSAVLSSSSYAMILPSSVVSSSVVDQFPSVSRPFATASRVLIALVGNYIVIAACSCFHCRARLTPAPKVCHHLKSKTPSAVQRKEIIRP
jgi:hypothetical protein